MMPRVVEAALLLMDLVVAFKIGRGHRLLTSSETEPSTGKEPWDSTR